MTRRFLLSLIPMTALVSLLPRFLSRWFPESVPIRLLGTIIFSQPSFSETCKLNVLLKGGLSSGFYACRYRLPSAHSSTQRNIRVQVRDLDCDDVYTSMFRLRNIPIDCDRILDVTLYYIGPQDTFSLAV